MGSADYPFESDFLKVARQDFSAKVNQVDFSTQAEPVRNEINTWVGDQTKGKIMNLLPAGVVKSSTRLVLVNAIYFKGHWENPFQKDNTQNLPFHLTPENQIDAPLMRLDKKHFKYGETDTFQLIELPYIGGELAMDILLPKEIGGLKKLEDSLNGATLNEQLALCRKEEVTAFLPKFKLTSQFGLADTLAAMGMAAPFSGQADFSGMDGKRDLFISAVIHKAYVELDEEGTEAAAATGAVMSLAMAAPRAHPVFRADHPFIFMIRDTRSGAILFLGRVVDPTK
jgi:serpin B